MRQVVLFDLDGTLTDPAEGITRSIQYACHRLGLPMIAQKELLSYIGPPIQKTFAALLKTDDAQAVQAAVDLYRERYADVGLFENRVYPGIEEMLLRLNEAAKRLFVATSKPTPYAVRILHHFDLGKWFAGIYGSELDGTRADKSALLSHILHLERLHPAEVAMVGDRKHDIIGARNNGVCAVGVTYGFGSVAELEEAGAAIVCDSPAQVAALFASPIG